MRQSRGAVATLTHAHGGIHHSVREPQALSEHAVWRKEEQQGDSCRANSARASICRDRDSSASAQAAAHEQPDLFRHSINKEKHLFLGIALPLGKLQSQRGILCGQDAHLVLLIADMQTFASVARPEHGKSTKQLPHAAVPAVALARKYSRLLGYGPSAPAQPAFPLPPRGRAHCSLPLPRSACVSWCSLFGSPKKCSKKKTLNSRTGEVLPFVTPFQETQACKQAGTLSALQLQRRPPLLKLQQTTSVRR